MTVRIVADDLTGALDTVAPFAAARGPIPVFWNGATAEPGSYALDTETREGGAAPSWVHHLQGAGLAFKKIDSLLRGDTAAEIAACLESGRFRSAIIAPAFPAQDRITRQGRQHWRATGELAWRAVDCDLLAVLRRSLPVLHARFASALGPDGFFLCDAETEAHLGAIVAAGERMTSPILWCGSAGLARTLAGAAVHQAIAPTAPLLMLIGSHHAVTVGQVAALAGHAPDLVVALRSSGRAAISAAVAQLADAVRQQRSSALALALPDADATTARAVLATVHELIATEVPGPGTLFVTGGETLYGLLRALDATSLLATGELSPGVPCSRIAGGRWHDVAVISKSGAFGERDLLIRLAESVMP